MKKNIFFATALMTAVVFVGAGCNNTPNTENTAGNADANVTSNSALSNSDTINGSTTGTSATATSAVSIQNMTFTPGSLNVKKGTTVTFTNNDTASHTATADDGSFDTGILAPGEKKTITFSTAGSFSYHCQIHSTMTGTVVVE